jgi:hypothetical protein
MAAKARDLSAGERKANSSNTSKRTILAFMARVGIESVALANLEATAESNCGEFFFQGGDGLFCDRIRVGMSPSIRQRPSQ